MSCPINATMSLRTRSRAPRHMLRVKRTAEAAQRTLDNMYASGQATRPEWGSMVDALHKVTARLTRGLVLVRKHGGVGLDELAGRAFTVA